VVRWLAIIRGLEVCRNQSTIGRHDKTGFTSQRERAYRGVGGLEGKPHGVGHMSGIASDDAAAYGLPYFRLSWRCIGSRAILCYRYVSGKSSVGARGPCYKLAGPDTR